MKHHTATWEWLMAGVAVVYAATLACSQYAPNTVAAAQATLDSPVAVYASPGVAQDPKQGEKIFTGKGNCYTCHGPAAKGTPLAPDLTDGEWLNTEPTMAGITAIVKAGVAQPKKHPAPMPPMGGAKLSASEIAAVAAYVYSLTQSR